MNSVDIDTSRAVDGFAGGTYTPSALLTFTGAANIAGIECNGGAGSAPGINATGSGNSFGIRGFGGPTDGTGIVGSGNASATNAIGVQGLGKGNLQGVDGIGDAGPGVYGKGVTGYGVVAETTTPATGRPPLRIVPQGSEPNILEDGGIWVRSDTDLMYVLLNSLTNVVMTDRADLTPKAWGKASTDGVGGASLDASAGCTAGINGNNLQITLSTSMGGVHWSCVATALGAQKFAFIVSQTATTVDIRLYDHTAGLIDMAASAEKVFFNIMGAW
jgi:hypothetical protein